MWHSLHDRPTPKAVSVPLMFGTFVIFLCLLLLSVHFTSIGQGAFLAVEPDSLLAASSRIFTLSSGPAATTPTGGQATIPPPPFHDLALADVAPRIIDIKQPAHILPAVQNKGNTSEVNVQVTAVISRNGVVLYEQAQMIKTIAPGQWVHLTFPQFAPTELGEYLIRAEVVIADDRLSNNQTTRILRVVDGKPDVWTKDNPEDNGDVPSNPWFWSPDLWVRNKDDGGLIHQDPIAGVPNTVYVRLRNRGDSPADGTVDVYWHAPALATHCNDWAYIDTASFLNLEPDEVRVVKVTWIPPYTGHTCLFDVVDSPLDPYDRALECSPERVPWDNNVEQRNLQVIANSRPAGSAVDAAAVYATEVELVNVYSHDKNVDLVVKRMTFPLSGTVDIQLPDYLFDRWMAHPERWDEGVQILTPTQTIRVTGAISATIGAIPMQANELAMVSLRFDGPVGKEYEVALEEWIHGVAVGGIGFQWIIPEDRTRWLPLIAR
ncbi:MAG: hypothetical protein HY328_02570 [Chloroflexi bacterium]|nr:hypothetical protein [Chloroflexota bacterium]